MASSLLSYRLAHLFLPPLRRQLREEAQAGNEEVRKKVLGGGDARPCSVGAFGQKQGRDRDKRPPKEPVKVVTNDRKDNKPPQNNNQQKPDKQKKP